ncbi:MAG: DmsC/YnfH family molybdoenzyme membrane anchor subunit, partial [Draconibacterium sp.]|nr:DmsC/YnfH family molybdoenzyme membrane anchor subunit [Draconibacterium sp.]
MIKHAWSLVFFTVLGQMGAGLYLGQKLILCYNRLFNSGIQLNSRRLLLFSFVLSLLALIVSFSHLGNPKNAFFALSNFRNSWLSKEIFFLSAFIGIMLFELVFANWFESSDKRELIISIVGSIISVAFIFSMIRLYRLETVPVWNSNYTFFNFYNTAFLGGLLILLLFST